MARLSKSDAVKARKYRAKTRRPKMKGVYLRSAEDGVEVYDVSITIEGTRRSKRLTIPTDTPNGEYVRAVEALQSEMRAECEALAVPDFNTLLDRYGMERGLAQHTILMMRAALKGFGLDDKANRAAVEQIVVSDYTDGTKKTKLKAVKGFYEWLRKAGVQVAQPVEGFKIPRQTPRQRIPTADEIERLCEHIAHVGTALDLLYLRLLLATGARCSTIEAVRACDMSDDWKVLLYNVKLGRRYAVRLPITDMATRDLWTQCTEGRLSTERLFDHRYGERLRARMGRLFDEDAYGERLSPHSLRHLKATTLANAGVPVKTAAAILDCSPTVLVTVYTTVQQADVDAALC